MYLPGVGTCQSSSSSFCLTCRVWLLSQSSCQTYSVFTKSGYVSVMIFPSDMQSLVVITVVLSDMKSVFTRCGYMSLSSSQSPVRRAKYVYQVPFTVVHKPLQRNLDPQVLALHARTRPFHLVSSYGLFRR